MKNARTRAPVASAVPADAPPLNGETITLHVTNLAARDARFLAEVISLFCDPHQAGLANALRAGATLHYGPDGRALVCPPHARN